MSLNWQTEEEPEWGEPSATTRPLRRWFWLAAVLLLAGGLLALYWLVNREAEDRTRQVESDLLASYAVMENAARQADGELFLYFLSGRDLAWTETWQQLVEEGAYLNREPFGITWLPVVDPVTAVSTITLNPQFNAAELVTEQTYSYDVGNGLTETVRLLHTAVFRRGRNRWLLAPPDETFWGAERVITGVHFSLQVPERDQEIAGRLAADLDDILAALCANPLFSCPPDFHVNVTFETDPAALSPDYRQVIFIAGSWLIRLPAPTLVGLPQDEAGYRALLRGYGAQLVNPVMRQLIGVSGGVHSPFLDAWLVWQLQTMGLRPYPLQTADWQELVRQAVPLSAGRQLFGASGTATPLTYAVIDFLIEDVGVTPQAIMQSFTSGAMTTYEDWLVDLAGGRFTLAELEARWGAYVQAQASPTR